MSRVRVRYSEDKHLRYPQGDPRGGQFAPKGASFAQNTSNAKVAVRAKPNIGASSDTPIPVGPRAKLSERLTPEKIEQFFADNEVRIITEDTEYGIAFTADGEHLTSKKGKSDVVEWSPKERKALAGGRVTHNHPNGSCFSNGDILFTHKNGLAELRAVGVQQEPPPPKRVRFVMEPDSNYSMLDRSEVEDALDLAYTRMRNAYARQSKRRPISEAETLSEFGHYQMLLFSKILQRDYGVDIGYRREVLT